MHPGEAQKESQPGDLGLLFFVTPPGVSTHKSIVQRVKPDTRLDVFIVLCVALTGGRAAFLSSNGAPAGVRRKSPMSIKAIGCVWETSHAE
jgi:hypothetical protein